MVPDPSFPPCDIGDLIQQACDDFTEVSETTIEKMRFAHRLKVDNIHPSNYRNLIFIPFIIAYVSNRL